MRRRPPEFRRPLVLTEHGHSAGVLLDLIAYVEELELLTDVRTSCAQIDAGKGISNRHAKSELRKRFAQ